jgi:hypothetical protein
MNEIIKSLKPRLQTLLLKNSIKKGTVKAKTAEFFFIQGVMAGNEQLATNPYLTIMLISGRSILDD